MIKATLHQLQSWFHHSIEAPSQRQWHQLKEHIVIDSGVDADFRLAIYQNGYVLRLLECLRSEYPLMIKAFTRDWFDSMARHYLCQNPSKSTNLNDLSKDFPAFLKRDRPDHNQEEKERAYDFMIALAEFERAKLEVGRLRGSERALNHGFAAFDLGESKDVSIVVAENVRLLRLPLDLIQYLEGDLQITPELLISKNQYLVLCRKEYKVVYLEVEDWQFAMISQLVAGVGLSEAKEAIATRYADIPVNALTPLFLTHLSSKGAIVDITQH